MRGSVPVVFSERVVRALRENFNESDETRAWMTHTRPSDPSQMKQLIALRERINRKRTKATDAPSSSDAESRASHVNWFKRPVVGGKNMCCARLHRVRRFAPCELAHFPQGSASHASMRFTH
jgi:hypothetical protein